MSLGETSKAVQAKSFLHSKAHLWKDSTPSSLGHRPERNRKLKYYKSVNEYEKSLFKLAPDCIMDGDFILPN